MVGLVAIVGQVEAENDIRVENMGQPNPVSRPLSQSDQFGTELHDIKLIAEFKYVDSQAPAVIKKCSFHAKLHTKCTTSSPPSPVIIPETKNYKRSRYEQGWYHDSASTN